MAALTDRMTRMHAGADLQAAQLAAGAQLLKDSARWAGSYAIVEVLAEQRDEVFCGTPTRVAQQPRRQLSFAALHAIRLQKLLRPQILLSQRDADTTVLRFLECIGKHARW